MDSNNAPPKRILILGGGTAGWMAAAMLANAWRKHDVEITLLESKAIGIIGVGEGSTPKMRRFFDGLGVAESEWMPACNATYKCGIRFPYWSTRKGFRSYYHPFFSGSDDPTIRAFFQNSTIRSRNFDAPAHPDAFFVSNYLSKNNRAPLPDGDTDYATDYAYHFDASLIGEFLRKHSLGLGVKHVTDTVTSVKQHENGDIAALQTEEHDLITADFFVDSTGFASILICKTLDVPFTSYKNILFNDRAVAMPTPSDDGTLPSQTISTALKYGWVWKIPLTDRFGNGYVYSSDHVDEEGAERELREHLGLEDDGSIEARHLKMRVGRVEKCWHKNCLAVGLSQGFIEPLEATALMIVQDTVDTFITRFEQGGFSDRYRAGCNERVNAIFDGIKNYIFMHYKLNTRDDTEYWIANRKNTHVSDDVATILDVWDNGGDLLGVLRHQANRHVYSPTSWYCILAGMGRFPRKPKKPKRNVQVFNPDDARVFCEQILPHFPDHRETIDRMSGNR